MQRFYTTSMVAECLGITTHAVIKLCVQGVIPYLKIKVKKRNSYYIPQQEFDAFVEANLHRGKNAKSN